MTAVFNAAVTKFLELYFQSIMHFLLSALPTVLSWAAFRKRRSLSHIDLSLIFYRYILIKSHFVVVEIETTQNSTTFMCATGLL
jgi:hypothetical protein